MKPYNRLIELNESSYAVRDLHNILNVLGYNVDKKEYGSMKAGENTLKQMRVLQSKLGLNIQGSTLMNHETLVAMNRLLKEEGQVPASRSFTVSGTVRKQFGQAAKNIQLLAFDLDLIAVALYKKIQNVKEFAKNGGFEYLGQTRSDNTGNYSVTFFDWQYSKAERKLADVVVFALEEEDIIGNSRMVNAEDYSDKGIVTGLTVLITKEEKRTEYDLLMADLSAFLKESGAKLNEIATSRDQLNFIASELDKPQQHIDIAAGAELITNTNRKQLSHEMLYGIGRQKIRLSLPSLNKKSEDELRTAIKMSASQRIIRTFDDKEINPFLKVLQKQTIQYILEKKDENGQSSLDEILSNALPEKKQRLSFINAVNTFQGDDFKKFWDEHLPNLPEFKEDPGLVKNLLVNQQLTALTGNHQALVSELQKNRKVSSVPELIQLEKKDWTNIIKKTGVPETITGTSKTERISKYADILMSMLNVTFPTQRIAHMVEKNEINIGKAKVTKAMTGFFKKNGNFNFASSSVHHFEKEIKEAAGEVAGELKKELMRVQRAYQVSTSPSVMNALLEKKLDSAYSIANIPQKSFMKTYGKALGGEKTAYAIHQRASHISVRAEFNAMHMMEYSHSLTPAYVLGNAEYAAAMTVMANQVPNYAELFGSPDICECEHCRSVYSAAAYLVDLLRFLWRSEPNSDGDTPYELLKNRRPDLVYLPLTCENTNTVLPYIDLVNEIMEYYAVNSSLASFEGYDTGDTTVAELRANPQNVNIEAYRLLKDAKYPFTLPYHQPLDVIRTYSGHLKTSRYNAMRAMMPGADATTEKAIEAEYLKISQEEYVIFTGQTFDGTTDTTALYEYFGYIAASGLKNMAIVREFLQRSGIAYTDLVELVKTNFINPFRFTLDFLEQVFSGSALTGNGLYSRLEQIKTGTLVPADDPDIMNALNARSITSADFADWVANHFGEFQQVITLFEPESKCDLDTTRLRTIKSIYEDSAASGINNVAWSKIHRFIRLWKKLGWTIQETDMVLKAIGESDITVQTISKLEPVALMIASTRRPINELAVLWGNIDTNGKKSTYAKLFLNKSVQEIDVAFKADEWGNYLQDNTKVLTNHKDAILAAYRMSEEDFEAILKVAGITDNFSVDPNPRPINIETDILNIENLSTLYRYVVLAKACKLKITELCQLIDLFGANPFASWDIHSNAYIDISPDNTYTFYQTAVATKSASFKSSVLAYIFEGIVPVDSNIGIDAGKAKKTAKTIRDAFSTVEQEHPESPEALTTDILSAKLSLTFQPSTAGKFIRVIEGSASFEAFTDTNLSVSITGALSVKYSYIKGSGRLTCNGVMTDAERVALKALPGANANFQSAIDELYTAPEIFLKDNFNGIFTNLAEANAILLDHPAHSPASVLDEKLAYVYGLFLPILKNKLKQDVIVQHIASLIGLSGEATALLIADSLSQLLGDLSQEGFSAEYFNNTTWTTPVLQRVDKTVDFAWGNASPDPLVTADNFSTRWSAYIAAPASDDYTLVVKVEEADEAFRLYLDEALVLEKTSGDPLTSWEIVTELNASQMHLLSLEYAEFTSNAGVRLYWKTASTELETIPSYNAYPGKIVDNFMVLSTQYHRAAKFIAGFGISETELNHFIVYKVDFDNIDFKNILPVNWLRTYHYTNLRNNIPQALSLLTDVFELANGLDPADPLDELLALLNSATAWDINNITYLATTHFSMSVSDFKNEIALNRIYDVMKIVSKSGLSAETIARWGAAETDFDVLHGTAQLLKNATKAKYEVTDWLELAGNLSDKIRENQKLALISYLLTLGNIKNAGITNADGLFEYFLIDVQMSPCMDTSRVVQANAAIQMYVDRCLLNLESNLSSGAEKGVSPDAIDKDRWTWMKNYRVWEANKKVFLYPENWLEPEWRNNRSAFFKELESFLVQNDISDRTVEEGFRNYLNSLAEVSNPEVCGMHEEKYDDGKLKFLHIFARTRNAPYKYFYRTWNEYMKWSAWEKVPVDIRSVERGAYSGVHLIPVIWKNRMFLFWPEFMEVSESPSGNSNKSAEELSEKNISTLEPWKDWEVRLAWSELNEGKWSSKQVSNVYADIYLLTGLTDKEADFSFTTDINEFNQELTIELWDKEAPEITALIAKFILSDIQSEINVELTHVHNGSDLKEYDADFMGWKRTAAQLDLSGDVYLQNYRTHQILQSNHLKYDGEFVKEPFFFTDALRTYFVRPVSISISNIILEPGYYAPLIPDIYYEYDPRFEVPLDDLERIPDEIINWGRGDIDPVPENYMFADMERNEVVMNNVYAGDNAIATNMSNMRMMAMGSETNYSGNALNETREVNYMVKNMYQSQVGSAFMEIAVQSWVYWGWHLRFDTGLEFHTFYHPFAGEFMKNLNRGGISRGNKSASAYAPGLMESDTEIVPDNGNTFKTKYNPNFTNGLVQGPTRLDEWDKRTYYKENVCFDTYGANSIYNWELFYHAPLYVATRLSKNGKFEEAMKWFHYIFDPTTDALPGPGESEISRYWKVLPFKTTETESLEDWFRGLLPNSNPATENAIIAEWRDNPFDPHLVAGNRPLAYMKHVVIKYIENLLDWGDFLFRQFTRESVYEALQIYVIANHILGDKPEFVPKRGEIAAESYHSLEDKWDDFSNALVELENIFPYSSETPVGSPSTGTSLLGIGSALYFCIPFNDKLLGLWSTAADRLFKIRHCQDINGVERSLALFSPPIDPAALIQAASQGLSLGSILAGLGSPPPIYRFTYMVQKANEFCNDVKSLGSALLSALEKKDSEELGRLRASQEINMLQMVKAVRERDILVAKSNRENLTKAREIAAFRLQHYIDLLGNDAVSVPAPPSISASLTADSQLPVDTNIQTIETDVDESLVEGDESGVKIIPKEKLDLDKSRDAMISQAVATAMEGLAGIFHLFPQLDGEGTPLGVGVGAWWGGQNLGAGTAALAKVPQVLASIFSFEAAQAAKTAGFIRREQDWTLQANLAAREIVQLDKQITSADIQVQIAEKELENHEQRINDSEEVELFLKNKFTNQELYQWMKEQLFAVFKQSYNLAFDMAKKAEQCYKYEIGVEIAAFINYGYWDNSMQGLVAGEKLQLALRQLEKSYMEENRRELEISKDISMAMLNPLALIELKETGKCYLSLPEEIFDFDYQGHYFRRIKSIAISMPCIAGPFTTVNCSLRLLKNDMRINTYMNLAGGYEHENDEGLWIDDMRFRSSNVPVTSVATSTGQNDAGLFEFSFRDERYLPFEGAGVISEWLIELGGANFTAGAGNEVLQQFDYNTIADVVFHVSYTARESGGLFKENAQNYLKDYIVNQAELSDQPFMRMFSMKHEFSTEWYKFLNPSIEGADQELLFTIGKERLPFFAVDRDVTVMKIEVFAKCEQDGDYNLILSHHDDAGDSYTSDEVAMAQNDTYGGINKVTIGATGAGLNLEDLDIKKEMGLKLKFGTATDYHSLSTNPDEVEDIFIVFHYKLG